MIRNSRGVDFIAISSSDSILFQIFLVMRHCNVMMLLSIQNVYFFQSSRHLVKADAMFEIFCPVLVMSEDFLLFPMVFFCLVWSPMLKEFGKSNNLCPWRWRQRWWQPMLPAVAAIERGYPTRQHRREHVKDITGVNKRMVEN